jgi:hypothetical protein
MYVVRWRHDFDKKFSPVAPTPQSGHDWHLPARDRCELTQPASAAWMASGQFRSAPRSERLNPPVRSSHLPTRDVLLRAFQIEDIDVFNKVHASAHPIRLMIISPRWASEVSRCVTPGARPRLLAGTDRTRRFVMDPRIYVRYEEGRRAKTCRCARGFDFLNAAPKTRKHHNRTWSLLLRRLTARCPDRLVLSLRPIRRE